MPRFKKLVPGEDEPIATHATIEETIPETAWVKTRKADRTFDAPETDENEDVCSWSPDCSIATPHIHQSPNRIPTPGRLGL